jgi:5-formyltetrahydrofolate cyclo-ligase
MQEIDRWRTDKRRDLIARRVAIEPAQREAWSAQIASNLRTVLAHLVPSVLGLYWPIRGEFDPRPMVGELLDQGWQLALPVVVRKGEPLEYHAWSPDAALDRGVFNIMVPRDGVPVLPGAVLAPLVGYDDALFRLGNGGGYFDRTLHRLAPMPLAIGVGFSLGHLETIHPQTYDRPMDVIVTEAGILR